jgi:hypothetical protein
MPITSTQTSRYSLASIMLDVEAGRAVVTLRWTVDGEDCGTREMEVQGEEFAALMSTAPEPGKTRADDMADGVYMLAIAKGIVSGEIG